MNYLSIIGIGCMAIALLSLRNPVKPNWQATVDALEEKFSKAGFTNITEEELPSSVRSRI